MWNSEYELSKEEQGCLIAGLRTALKGLASYSDPAGWLPDHPELVEAQELLEKLGEAEPLEPEG